jgi:hypothetical protein
MIELFTDAEKKFATKNQLIDLEANMLIVFGFDFNFPGPVQPLERFLKVLGYDDNNIVKDMALEICKFSLNDPIFLNYRPSMVAACSLLISINIFENNSGKNLKFIENCRQNSGLRQMNLQIWNTQEVHLTTGYSIEEIKKCLYDLSLLISNNNLSDTL